MKNLAFLFHYTKSDCWEGFIVFSQIPQGCIFCARIHDQVAPDEYKCICGNKARNLKIKAALKTQNESFKCPGEKEELIEILLKYYLICGVIPQVVMPTAHYFGSGQSRAPKKVTSKTNPIQHKVFRVHSWADWLNPAWFKYISQHHLSSKHTAQ